MARETKEQMKLRLETEIAQLKEQRDKAWAENQQLTTQLYAKEDNIEDEFKKTTLYIQMQREIDQLKLVYASSQRAITNLENDKVKLIDRLEQLQKLINEQPQIVHNARGAGRKNKFNQAEIAQIKAMYADGHTMRAIAKHMGCSHSLVCKLINKQNLK